MTARQAIAHLRANGRVTVRRGAGTYVAQPANAICSTQVGP
jgi:DNA-binding GntR family transcriptional regulator